jgi:hypothetical protein
MLIMYRLLFVSFVIFVSFFGVHQTWEDTHLVFELQEEALRAVDSTPTRNPHQSEAKDHLVVGVPSKGEESGAVNACEPCDVGLDSSGVYFSWRALEPS